MDRLAQTRHRLRAMKFVASPEPLRIPVMHGDWTGNLIRLNVRLEANHNCNHARGLIGPQIGPPESGCPASSVVQAEANAV